MSLRRVQEDGAEGGQDLSGLGGGEAASGPHQAHAVSFPQRQDQAEGHRAAAAAAVAPGDGSSSGARALQLLDATVGYGQDGLHAVALAGGEEARDQVAAVDWHGEDPCGAER